MYEPHEIEISYKYLKTVVGKLEEPICLIGGWTVYHHAGIAGYFAFVADISAFK